MAQPRLFVAGGSNGAGKSTFARQFLLENPDYVFLNADEIARDLNPADVHSARIDAGRRFLIRMEELRDVQANVLVESTLSGLSLVQQIKSFVRSGYYIGMAYVLLPSAELAISRVAGRVLQGGHDVPSADIIRRFQRSRRNFWHTYRLLADEWQLIVNQNNTFEYVARFVDFELDVQNANLFEQFVTEQTAS